MFVLVPSGCHRELIIYAFGQRREWGYSRVPAMPRVRHFAMLRFLSAVTFSAGKLFYWSAGFIKK
jgi:nitrate reductase alpha subunit